LKVKKRNLQGEINISIMKIVSIELFHISIPFAVPYRLSKKYGTLTHADAVIFKIHTDEGIIGLGEADPMNPFTAETPSSVMAVTRDIIAPLLIGRDPVPIAMLEATLDQGVCGNPTARGAVNMALHDIVGKAYNVPVYLLLGGLRHNRLPLLGPIGSGSPAEDADAIETLYAEGYRTVMIKMGALPVADEIKRMIAADQRFGDRMTIITDANQGWETTETLAFIDGVNGHSPGLIEQPIRSGNINDLKRIRDHAPCPLSVDESLVTAQDATTLIREQAADVFSIKVSKNGGLTKSSWIAHTAALFGIKCLMNSMLEFGITQAASLHLGLTLPNLVDMGHAYMSVLRMADDVTDFRRNISRAVVTPPEGSGLGIALDEERLKKYTRDYIKIG